MFYVSFDIKIQQRVLFFVKEFNWLNISLKKRLFISRDLIITVLDWFITKRRNILIEKTSPRQVGEKEKIRQFSEGHWFTPLPCLMFCQRCLLGLLRFGPISFNLKQKTSLFFMKVTIHAQSKLWLLLCYFAFLIQSIWQDSKLHS